MNIRESYEKTEELIFSPYALLSKNTKGRDEYEEPCDIRTEFQRDRDRVIHCKAFRRLKHKTQVFLSPEGDHFRTRLTHTLEVAQIARTMSRALRLNEDLTEAIALAHDLGHTPFGHAGERALDDICGFRHYEQGVRVVEKLEKEGKGLNLTAEVRNGILCHTRGKEADTLEGRIVKMADQIAFLNHDFDDAVRAGAIKENELPKDITDVLGNRRTARIDTLVKSVIFSSGEDIIMDEETGEAFKKLHEFMFERVYRNPYVKEEEKKVPGMIEALFDYLKKTEKLPEEMKRIAQQEGIDRAVCDYIACMTDHFAVTLYEDLFVPKGWDQR